MNSQTDVSDDLGISVVIPCFNAGRYLRETIESITTQDYTGPVEIVVSDDGSSDNSLTIAESYGDRVKLVLSSNGRGTGPSATRNRGILAASNPLIAFLDADDLWLPGYLSTMVKVIAAHPEIALAYGKGYFVSEEGKRLGPVFPEPHRPCVTPDELLPNQCFSVGAVIVRRSALDAVGLFDESIQGGEDQDLWLRILESFSAVHVPFYGFCYRRGDYGQLSLNPKMWKDAERVLQKAVHRYPYTKKAIRKRKAVLAYRFSQIERGNSRYLKSMCLLGKAALLDPVRAVKELSGRVGRLRKRLR
jgi:glycosyltransferase involved in cell wall biosynthesis